LEELVIELAVALEVERQADLGFAHALLVLGLLLLALLLGPGTQFEGFRALDSHERTVLVFVVGLAVQDA